MLHRSIMLRTQSTSTPVPVSKRTALPPWALITGALLVGYLMGWLHLGRSSHKLPVGKISECLALLDSWQATALASC